MFPHSGGHLHNNYYNFTIHIIYTDLTISLIPLASSGPSDVIEAALTNREWWELDDVNTLRAGRGESSRGDSSSRFVVLLLSPCICVRLR